MDLAERNLDALLDDFSDFKAVDNEGDDTEDSFFKVAERFELPMDFDNGKYTPEDPGNLEKPWHDFVKYFHAEEPPHLSEHAKTHPNHRTEERVSLLNA
jgi:hypothetical protein